MEIIIFVVSIAVVVTPPVYLLEIKRFSIHSIQPIFFLDL